MSCNIKLKKGELTVQGGGLGKEEMFCRELERKRVELCGFSEHRWSGKGEKKHGDHTFLL